MKGSVTIGLVDFDYLRERAETYEQITREITKMVRFDEREYRKKLEEINELYQKGEQISKKEEIEKYNEAISKLVIYVDEKSLKKMIKQYLNPEAGNEQYGYVNMDDEELDKIQIKIEGREKN